MADTKRLNYFNKFKLAAQDFLAEQAYHVDAQRRHYQLLHTSGVVEGLDVATVAGTEIEIGPGAALDREGREIVLLEPFRHTLDTATPNADVYLTIAYREVPDDADHYQRDGVDDFTRITERPLVQDSNAPPPDDGSVILLARIHFDGSTAISGIDVGVRPVASAALRPGSLTTTLLANGSVTPAQVAAHTVAAAKLDGFARGQHGVFLETFEQLPNDWINVAGEGVESIRATGVTGGNVLRVEGYRWRVFPRNIPFDPSKLYRIRFRVRPIAHATVAANERAFVGLEGVAADGITLVNRTGENSPSSQHYFWFEDLSVKPLGTWIEFTSWFQGHAATGTSSASPVSPSRLHTNVRYFRPLFGLGYDGGNGTAEIDSIAIDVFDEDGIARAYSALNDSGTIVTDKVSTAAITDGAVTGPRFGPGAVTQAGLHDNSVTEIKLANGAVTLNKLGPNSVDGTKLAAGSVDTTQLGPGSVHDNHLADKIVGIAQLAAPQSLDVPIDQPMSVDPGSVPATVVLDTSPTSQHRLVLWSIIAVTADVSLRCQESHRKKPDGTSERVLNVFNLSTKTVSFIVRAYAMPIP